MQNTKAISSKAADSTTWVSSAEASKAGAIFEQAGAAPPARWHVAITHGENISIYKLNLIYYLELLYTYSHTNTVCTSTTTHGHLRLYTYRSRKTIQLRT